MNAIQPGFEMAVHKDAWSVVILYDDASSSRRAMPVCDHLARQFPAEIEFEFHWWRMDFLDDPDLAATAAAKARDAEFVIVCCGPESELTPTVKKWFENWTPNRAGREGALLDLTGSDGVSIHRSERTKAYLREAARRATMDYLAQFPPGIAGMLPDSFESAALRADQVTSVLSDILRQSPPPSHYGLNE